MTRSLAANGGPRVLSDDELAARLGVAVRTVRSWRAAGTGPTWFYAGKSPRYREDAVTEWIAAQEKRLSGGDA